MPRVRDGRYIGVTEPGIIAAEAPNPIVNQLVILPDMEKRLEAFVRIAHGIVVFPGGVGTAEELLYLLGVLAEPRNADQPLPVVLTGPRESAAYFTALDAFIRDVLGADAAARYRLVLGDADAVAEELARGIPGVMRYRDENDDASYYNWRLVIDPIYQAPFAATHAAMAGLTIARDLPRHELAANLRRLFSGIVAGNVKESGIAASKPRGRSRSAGSRDHERARRPVAAVQDRRMRLPGRTNRVTNWWCETVRRLRPARPSVARQLDIATPAMRPGDGDGPSQ